MSATTAGERGLPPTPEGWELLGTGGPGPFVTRAEFRRPDGVEVQWTSRRSRKGLGLRVLSPGAATVRPPVPRRTWWIASLFAIGSACFALGSTPWYLDNVSARIDGLTFFIGSVFFTAASYLCFAEVSSSPDHIKVGPARPRRFRPASWRPRTVDWWSAAVQLVGTFYFNVMTLLALNDNWSVHQERRLVWRPDMVGSICFLVASYLAWAEVCHSAGRLRVREVSWWIVVLNLLGSIAFGVSAIGAFVDPQTGDVKNFRWDNGGTFVGAVCFLVAAVLLVPEARSAREPGPDGAAALVPD